MACSRVFAAPLAQYDSPSGNNHWRSILRQSAKPLLLRDGLKQKRKTASLNLSGTGVYPPMLFIRLCRPKNESAMTREEIEQKMDELAREICG